jgi:hypothetical protein
MNESLATLKVFGGIIPRIKVQDSAVQMNGNNLLLSVFNAFRIPKIPTILGYGNPTKVFNVVVNFVAVDVVNLWQIVRVIEESASN